MHGIREISLDHQRLASQRLSENGYTSYMIISCEIWGEDSCNSRTLAGIMYDHIISDFRVKMVSYDLRTKKSAAAVRW